MFRTRPVAVALAASALAATGCGGSTSSSSQSASHAASTASASTANASSGGAGPLTRAQMIAKVNAICLGINAKRAGVHFTTEQDVARLMPPLAAYEHAAVAELRKLVPPASMVKGAQEIVSGFQTVADVTVKAGEYAARHKLEHTQKLSAEMTRATHKVQVAGEREGFPECYKPLFQVP
jgi:hypothetical protein